MLHTILHTPDNLQAIDNVGKNGKFKLCDVYTYISHNITARETTYSPYGREISKYIYMCKHIISIEKPYRPMGYKLSRLCILVRNVQTSWRGK
jgi:hypothetical protein